MTINSLFALSSLLLSWKPLRNQAPSSKPVVPFNGSDSSWRRRHHLGVRSWEDMVVFSAHDVEEEIKESKNPGPLKSVLLHKKLGYIFEFAKYGTLDTETTMNHIVHVIDEAKAGSTKGEEIVKKVGLDKKIVPTLEKFDDEDFYAFQDSTMNWLGQAGLACYLTDADVMSSNKEAGKAVFYAICSSLQGRDARCFLSDGIV